MREFDRKTFFHNYQIMNKFSSVYSCFDEIRPLNNVHITVVPLTLDRHLRLSRWLQPFKYNHLNIDIKTSISIHFLKQSIPIWWELRVYLIKCETRAKGYSCYSLWRIHTSQNIVEHFGTKFQLGYL